MNLSHIRVENGLSHFSIVENIETCRESFDRKVLVVGHGLAIILVLIRHENILSHLSISENIEICKDSFETKVLVAGHGLRQFWRLFKLKIFYRTCRLLKILKPAKKLLKQRF